MRILVLSPSFEWISWNMSHGIAPTLEQMGHTTTHAPIPDTDFKPIPAIHQRTTKNLIAASARYDLAIITAAEKLDPHTWQFLECPRALWLIDLTHMSHRDYSTRYETLLKLTPHIFFPATQDAAYWHKPWLPFGVDHTLFHPHPDQPKLYANAFVGHLHTQRPTWLRSIHDAGIHLSTPHLNSQPWRQTEAHARQHAENLARLYCSSAVIIDAPGGGETHSTRLTEALACAVPIITPELAEIGAANTSIFSPRPLTYDRHHPETIQRLLNQPDLLKQTAARSLADVLAHHTLAHRLQTMLDLIHIDTQAQTSPH